MKRKKEDLRIIFLGNPEFARYHLEKIVEAGYNVVAVISAPDRPAGRGLKLTPTPVTKYARELGLPCLQPKNLKNPDFIEELKSFKADLQVVIAFRMLPVVVWDMPPLGTYNLHGSLLPKYRGAAPINWAIINGEEETGVTTFKLKHEIDTGNIIVQESCKIESDDTASSLHDKLMILGGEATLETLEQIVNNTVKETEQDLETEITKAPKLNTNNTQVNWNDSVDNVYNFIRGLNPFPAAHSSLEGKIVKFYAVAKINESHNLEPGTIVSDNKSFLKVACKNGFINLLNIKMQGKRMLEIADFLNGYDVSNSNQFT